MERGNVTPTLLTKDKLDKLVSEVGLGKPRGFLVCRQSLGVQNQQAGMITELQRCQRLLCDVGQNPG